MNMEKLSVLKRITSRRYFLYAVAVASAIVLVYSSIGLSLAYKHPVTVSSTSTSLEAVAVADVSTAIHIRPSLLYDYADVIKASTAPVTLARGVEYNLSYRLSGKRVTELSYRRTVVLSTREWSKTLNDTGWVRVDAATLRLHGYINLTGLAGMVKTINRELGLGSYGYKYVETIAITARTSDGKTYSLTPRIVLEQGGSGDKKIHVSTAGTRQRYTETSSYTAATTTTLGPYTGPTGDARRLFLATTLVSGLVLAATLYSSTREQVPEHIRELEKHRDIVVHGEVKGVFTQVIELETIRDLIKTAYSNRQNIVETKNGEYIVVTSQTLYVYKPAENRGNNNREDKHQEIK